MAEEVMSQWVIRLPDRLIQLYRPIKELRVFSTAEVLQFQTDCDSGELKSIIEQQHDANERREDVKFAYWILLFPQCMTRAFKVLCCTVQRATADRILDQLWQSLFSNCGDNTFVDLRELLAADRVTPEQVAAAAATGRFVDLGDGDLQRPAATVASVDAAAIPVQTIPNRRMPERDLSLQESRQWLRMSGTGGSVATRNANAADYPVVAAVDMQMDVARHTDPVRVQPIPGTGALTAAELSRIEANVAEFLRSRDAGSIAATRMLQPARPALLPADVSAIMQQSTVPDIRAAMDQADDPDIHARLGRQLQAGNSIQQAENRNTIAAPIPTGVDYSEYLQPSDFADVPPVPPDNDAVDRVDPDF